ncbi:MAG: TolB family protein, partial [Chloroflexia bacterium]
HWRSSPLWVVNLDGTGLQQVAPDAGQILWSPNSRAIFYTLGQAGPPTKLASLSRQDQGWVGIERVDLATGKIERILTLEGTPSLQLLGWSAGGQWLYHIRRNLETREFELWKTRQDGSESRFILSLGLNLPEPSRILLSPEGSRLLIDTRWISTDGQEEGDIQHPPGSVFDVIWGEGENEVIVGQRAQDLYHLYAINLRSQHVRELATFAIAADFGWYHLALSPDHHWLMAQVAYYDGSYWIHLPTGMMVSIPSCPRCWLRFVAWIPSGAGR